jgi:hypothetical protein
MTNSIRCLPLVEGLGRGDAWIVDDLLAALVDVETALANPGQAMPSENGVAASYSGRITKAPLRSM